MHEGLGLRILSQSITIFIFLFSFSLPAFCSWRGGWSPPSLHAIRPANSGETTMSPMPPLSMLNK